MKEREDVYVLLLDICWDKMTQVMLFLIYTYIYIYVDLFGISVYFFVEQFPFQDLPKNMGMPRFCQVIFAWTHPFAPPPPLQVRKTHLDRVEVVGGIAAGIHKEGLEKFSSKQ